MAGNAKTRSEYSGSPSSGKEDRGRKKNNDNSVPSAADLLSIHLEGEEDEEIPIFDSCDDVRRKLKEQLKHTTQVHLSHELTEMLPKSEVLPRRMGAFLKYSGPQAGAHNIVFYAAYVYFEKIRIKEGKKKTAKREEIEKHWSKPRDNAWQSSGSKLGGFPRIGDHNARLSLPEGDEWMQDQYGEVVKLCRM